jgi:hypothetical protein
MQACHTRRKPREPSMRDAGFQLEEDEVGVVVLENAFQVLRAERAVFSSMSVRMRISGGVASARFAQAAAGTAAVATVMASILLEYPMVGGLSRRARACASRAATARPRGAQRYSSETERA